MKQHCPWGLTGLAGEVASINCSTKKPLEYDIVKFVWKIICLLKIAVHYASQPNHFTGEHKCDFLPAEGTLHNEAEGSFLEQDCLS